MPATLLAALLLAPPESPAPAPDASPPAMEATDVSEQPVPASPEGVAGAAASEGAPDADPVAPPPAPAPPDAPPAPAPQPEFVEPPLPAPEPVPVGEDPAFPAFDPTLAPTGPQLLPPPPPPDGSGRLVGGSFSVVLGLAAASVVVVEGSREGGNFQFAAATFIPIGLAGLGIGTYLLVRGGQARRNFNDWKAYTGERALPSGSGLMVGGTMGIVVGGVSLVAASVQSREPDAFRDPLAPTLWTLAAAGVGGGVTALTFGILRRNKYRTWRQRTFLANLQPNVYPLAGGAGFDVTGAAVGLSGRF